ncbi:MAG: hypothetical protein ACKPAD_03530, partial [Bacteroidota bacterium]
LKISNVYDLNKIALEAPEQIIDEVASIIEMESEWYKLTEQDLPLLSFSKAFEEYFRTKWGNSETVPRDYFQKGIEILLFLLLRAKQFRKDVYKRMKEQGRIDPDIKSICRDLDAAF